MEENSSAWPLPAAPASAAAPPSKRWRAKWRAAARRGPKRPWAKRRLALLLWLSKGREPLLRLLLRRPCESLRPARKGRRALLRWRPACKRRRASKGRRTPADWEEGCLCTLRFRRLTSPAAWRRSAAPPFAVTGRPAALPPPADRGRQQGTAHSACKQAQPGGAGLGSQTIPHASCLAASLAARHSASTPAECTVPLPSHPTLACGAPPLATAGRPLPVPRLLPAPARRERRTAAAGC